MKKIIRILIVLVLAMSIGTVVAQENYAAEHTVESTNTSVQIQALIDAAGNGDTIKFLTGTYDNISLIINKTLNIVADDEGVTINANTNFTKVTQEMLNAVGNYTAAFYFVSGSEDSVLSGFHLNASDEENTTLISAKNTNGLVIQNNTLTNGYYGVYAYTIYDVLFKNNTITNISRDGFSLFSVSNVTIKESNISNATRNGISITHSSSNFFAYDNILKDCVYGIFVGATQNVVINNNNITNSTSGNLVINKVINANITNNNFTNSTYGILLRDEYINIQAFNNTYTKTHPIAFDSGSKSNMNGNFTSSGFQGAANLAVSTSIPTPTIKNGATTTYNVKVSNNGVGAAKNITVKDILPTGVNVVSSSATRGTFSNGTWAVSSLGADGDAVLTIVVKGKTAGTYATTSKVSYKDDTSGTTNKTANAPRTTLTINKDIQLSSSVSVDKSSVKKGKNVKISVKVANNGIDNSGSVTIYDKLPSSLKRISVTLASLFKSNKWTASKIDSKKSQTFVMTVKVNKKGTNKVPVYVNGVLVKTVTIKGV
ncbi:MAG: right-handed parallel beta-helix repeat-containing protein [Methanobacteriaceae archaeon]